MGIYTYTEWKENYPVQPYNREKVAAALDTIPDKGQRTDASQDRAAEARGHPQATVGQDGRLRVLGR